MKLPKKYRPAIVVSVQRRVYDPETKRQRYDSHNSFTVHDATPEQVFAVLRKAIEKESRP